MNLISRRALCMLAFCAAWPVVTQAAPPQPEGRSEATPESQPTKAPLAAPTPPLAPPNTPLPPAPAASGSQPPVAEKRVIEDRQVRIEETRLRGQVTSITVKSKLPGVQPYDILIGPGGRELSPDRGAEGQSAWTLFSF